MLKNLFVSISTLALATIACGAPALTNTAVEAQTQVAAQVQATLDAIGLTATAEYIVLATPTAEDANAPAPTDAPTTQSATAAATGLPARSDTPTPTATLVVIPPAIPPVSALFPDINYTLHDERIIGPYAVRLWRDTNRDAIFAEGVATIQREGMPTRQIEQAVAINPLTGSDITGNDTPDAIIETYSGGAHCCSSLKGFELGEGGLLMMVDAPESNCGQQVEDLDGDDVFEILTCDDSFAYEFCSFAGSPLVRVVMQYDPAIRGYVPASYRFPNEYNSDIAAHNDLATSAGPGEMGEWDDTNKCGVLHLVLDYLYSGQESAAWSALYTNYAYADVDAFQSQIETLANNSPLFSEP